MSNEMQSKTAAEKVAEETKQVVDQAQDKAGELTSTVKQQTRQAADEAADQARTMADARKEDVVYELEGVAHALRDVGDTLRDQDQGHLAKYSNEAADRIDRVQGYLSQRNVSELLTDAEDFGRRQPELFLGGAFTAGLLIGRFFKSSASGSRSRDDSDRRSRDYSSDRYGMRSTTDFAGSDAGTRTTPDAPASTPVTRKES